MDTLTVLAMVEVLRTSPAHFTEGRVKVTYIIDTVIVTVLTEVMAFWYRGDEVAADHHGHRPGALPGRGRIVTVRFSPRKVREEL